MNWPRTNALETVALPCEEGIEGTYNRTCSAEGQWGPIQNFCELPNMCPQEELDGKLWPQTGMGETASLPCDGGMIGSLDRTCLSDGQWGEVVNSCGRYIFIFIYLIKIITP